MNNSMMKAIGAVGIVAAGSVLVTGGIATAAPSVTVPAEA